MTGRWFRRSAWTAVAAVTVSLSGVLTGCGSSSGGSGAQTIRFEWWGNQDRADATKKAVALFEKKNPGIKVKTEFSGYPDYVQKLTTQMAGGAPPDLMQLDRPTFGEYVNRHVLADLGGAASVKTDKIPANLLSGGKVDGGQYAVPAGQTAQMLVYDPKLFAKAGVTVPSGWTWQEFASDMDKVGAASGRTGTTDFGWAVDWFESWLHTQGKQLYTSQGKLGFTAADLTRFWNLTGSMRGKKGVSGAQATTKMDGSMETSALVLGQAASEINYDSSLTAYDTSYKGTLKVAPLPTGSGNRSGMAALPPVYYGVAQHSSHKDAAEKLLDFLVNDPKAGKVLGATRGLPANSTIRTQVCGDASPGDKAVCDYEKSVSGQLGASGTWLWPTGSSAIKTDFQQVYDDVIFGRTSVSSAANRVVKDAQQSLDS